LPGGTVYCFDSPAEDTQQFADFGFQPGIPCRRSIRLQTTTHRRVMQTATQAAINDLQVRAESGDARAQFEFGLCFENGSGVPRDPATALDWYFRAAAQGVAEAQFKVGLLSQRRALTSVNGIASEAMVEAYKWYKVAAVAGDRNAREHRDWAALRMNRPEVEEGNRRAAAFLASHNPA
jgi:TPR repeat protein